MFPPKYSFPSILPFTPLPETEVKSFISASSMFSSFIFCIIASANGCSEFFSKLPAIFNNSFSSIVVKISVTFGFPSSNCSRFI